MENEWRFDSYVWKLVSFRLDNGSNPILDYLLGAGSSSRAGFLWKKMIPMFREFQRDREHKITYEVCYDCSGKQVSKTRVLDEALNAFEDLAMHNTREGDPMWIIDGMEGMPEIFNYNNRGKW